MVTIAYYIVLFVFTLLFFFPFVALFFLTVLFDKERVVLHRASRLWSLAVYRFCPGWRVKVEGLEKIDRTKNYVIVTNHQAMLDVPLMYVLPLNFKWVSKREVLRMPIFGWVLQMHGDIAIERGSSRSARHMMDQATEILHRGRSSVILFPEGTRTKNGHIGRFKEGAFLMAQLAGVGILPVIHEGNGSALDGKQLRTPHRFTVRVLDPLTPQQVAATPLKELTQQVNATMQAAHEALLTENE